MIKLYKKYIRHKMFNKMILIYSTITIISIFLLSNIFINYYLGNVLRNELKIHSEVIFNIEKRFEEQNNITNSIINGINTQPNIIEEVSILNTSTYEEYLSYKLDNFTSSNIKPVDLKYVVDTMLSNREDALAVEIKDTNNEYRSEIVLDHDKWYETKKSSEENTYVRKITKPIKNIDTMYTIGYIDVYFDLDNLNKIINNTNLKGDLIILDQKENIVFASNKISKEEIDKYIKTDQKYISNGSDELNDKFIKNNPVISTKEDVPTRFKYKSIIKKQDLSNNHISLQIGSISFICIFTIIMTTYIAIKTYSNKLKNMMKKMNRIKDGDLGVRFNIEQEDDELDMIAIRIDKMSESLQYNIDKNYIAEVKQKEAELNALQAQIKPHFLYNTLEVIRMSSLASKNTEVAQMIYNLASIFRYSTYGNGNMVTLNDEINNCKMYLDLCKTRYKGILEYDIDIEEDYLKYRIPKFSLQPILENYINHGIKKDYEENRIYIYLIEEESYIKIVIKDNGLGIDQNRLSEIVKGLEKNLNKNSSIGLMNINNRLKLKFGNKYGINIESEINKGTIVEIKLPIIRMDEKNV